MGCVARPLARRNAEGRNRKDPEQAFAVQGVQIDRLRAGKAAAKSLAHRTGGRIVAMDGRLARSLAGKIAVIGGDAENESGEFRARQAGQRRKRRVDRRISARGGRKQGETLQDQCSDRKAGDNPPPAAETRHTGHVLRQNRSLEA